MITIIARYEDEQVKLRLILKESGKDPEVIDICEKNYLTVKKVDVDGCYPDEHFWDVLNDKIDEYRRSKFENFIDWIRVVVWEFLDDEDHIFLLIGPKSSRYDNTYSMCPRRMKTHLEELIHETENA
jgi:hypothetical protein